MQFFLLKKKSSIELHKEDAKKRCSISQEFLAKSFRMKMILNVLICTVYRKSILNKTVNSHLDVADKLLNTIICIDEKHEKLSMLNYHDLKDPDDV